jgi:hypothetical protein
VNTRQTNTRSIAILLLLFITLDKIWNHSSSRIPRTKHFRISTAHKTTRILITTTTHTRSIAILLLLFITRHTQGNIQIE